jgi:hypothetical protein
MRRKTMINIGPDALLEENITRSNPQQADRLCLNCKNATKSKGDHQGRIIISCERFINILSVVESGYCGKWEARNNWK